MHCVVYNSLVGLFSLPFSSALSVVLDEEAIAISFAQQILVLNQ
jgi:hypothetical protein